MRPAEHLQRYRAAVTYVPMTFIVRSSPCGEPGAASGLRQQCAVPKMVVRAAVRWLTHYVVHSTSFGSSSGAQTPPIMQACVLLHRQRMPAESAPEGCSTCSQVQLRFNKISLMGSSLMSHAGQFWHTSLLHCPRRHCVHCSLHMSRK